MKKTRFLVPEDDPVSIYRDKRHSFTNDRTLNPSVSGADQDSVCSTLEIDCTPDHLNQRLAELRIGDSHQVKSIQKPVVSRTSSIVKTPKFASSKVSATNKKSMKSSKNCKTVRKVVNPLCFHMTLASYSLGWGCRKCHVVYSELSMSPLWLC